MPKVKVLQVGLSSYPGGVENAIMNHYRHIDREQIQIDFVCTEASLAYSDEIEKAGSRVYYLTSPKKNLLRYAAELKETINNGTYDIVHVNMLSGANIFSVLFSKGTAAKRIIAHSHNANLPGRSLKKMAHHILKPLIPLLTKEWMACSTNAAKWLFGARNVRRVYILKNAISQDRFRFDAKTRMKMRKVYNIAPTAPVIGHVGRFGQEKNHRYLVDLFAKIKTFLPDAKLLLIGTGTLLDAVTQQIEQLGLSKSVIIAGRVNDTASYYQMMDIFCLPSVFEGLGIVAVEAQTSGLPCVCSTGVPQETVFNANAKRVDLADQEEWIRQTLDLLNQGRIVVGEFDLEQAGYSINTEAKKLEQYYKKGSVYEST